MAGSRAFQRLFWLAAEPTLAYSWSQAGAMARHGLAGYWWAAVSEEDWPSDLASIEEIKKTGMPAQVMRVRSWF